MATDFTAVNSEVQKLIDAAVTGQKAVDAVALQAALDADAAADKAATDALNAQIVKLQADLAACQAGNPPSVDTTPPTAPTNLVATVVSTTQINLTWVASTDNVGVKDYVCFKDGVTVGSTLAKSYSYSGLTAATTYRLAVKARDAAGNLSAAAWVNATTSSVINPPPTDFVWPNAGNTGVQAGTVLSPYSGPSTISISGTTIVGKSFSGGVEVTGSNVTFRNCRFAAGSSWTINGDTARDMTIQNCEFAGNGSTGSKAILAQGNILNNHFYGIVIAVTLKDGKSTVKGNYIHDLRGASGEHTDGVFISGGQQDCLIEDNLISMPTISATASVFIATRWAGSNIIGTIVNHNRLLGSPSYAMYSEQTSVATISGTRWTNNEVQRGAYGYWTITGNTVYRSGNKDAFSGANIDNS